MSAEGAREAVSRALDLLNRASADWRNGMDAVPGPLHWPVSVSLARRALRQALEIIEGGSTATATPATSATHSAHCRHCGGTGFEGDEPCEFCSATGRDGQLEDALRGSIWFNGLSRTERMLWLAAAATAVPAEAWSYYKSGGSHGER